MYEATWGRRLLRLPSMFIAAALIAGTGLSMMPAVTASAVPPPPPPPPPPPSLCTPAYTTTQFGPNVCVFTPPSGPTLTATATDLAAIQTVLNNIATEQVPLSAQFDDQGYALLFKPGTYGSASDPLVFQVGYYTEVAGLGAQPQDTIINGQIDAFPNALDSETQCAPSYAGPGDCTGPGTGCYLAAGQTCYWANSTVNFWRSLSDLTINVTTGTPIPLGAPGCADAAQGGTNTGPCANPPTLVPTPTTMEPPINDGNCFGALPGGDDFWSVSQATPVRDVILNGSLVFQSFCSETNYQSNNYGSGSYVANDEINGQLDWSGNQQGIAVNTDFDSAVGYVWNYVYSGDQCPPGYTPPAPATACSPTEDAFNDSYDIASGTDGIYGVNQITELPQSPASEQGPFLYTNSTGTRWNAFVPAVQGTAVGPNFLNAPATGTSVPLSSFFTASPSTPESQIQTALDAGHNLILTPGTYDLDAPLTVSHADTDVLGLGFPVLVPQQGKASMVVVPNNGVKLSGVIFDAGPVNSPVLLSVGTPGPNSGGIRPANNSANDPDLIQDVFFRIGGAETTPVSATLSLLDNADNSIIDDVWAWRADHGADTSVTDPPGCSTATAPPFCQVGAGWTYNLGTTGLEVTGDNVTAYGLAIEHYQQNEVVWSGNNGTVIFFQNELPYDAPSQTAWEASPVQPGYPSFLVSNNVQNFKGYGMASYVVFIYTNAILWDAAAFEAPQTPGVSFTDAMDLFISSTCSVNGNCPTPSQSGGDDSVIDGVGGPATNGNPTTPVDVDSYVNGAATLP